MIQCKELYMRSTKKLNRTQRNLLSKCGYTGDLSGIQYLKEDKDYIYFFVLKDNTVLKYDKSLKEIAK